MNYEEYQMNGTEEKSNRQSNQTKIIFIFIPFPVQHNKPNKYFMNSSDMLILFGVFIELNY
jgi:hypothetical protein